MVSKTLCHCEPVPHTGSQSPGFSGSPIAQKGRVRDCQKTVVFTPMNDWPLPLGEVSRQMPQRRGRIVFAYHFNFTAGFPPVVYFIRAEVEFGFLRHQCVNRLISIRVIQQQIRFAVHFLTSDHLNDVIVYGNRIKNGFLFSNLVVGSVCPNTQPARVNTSIQIHANVNNSFHKQPPCFM